MTIRIDVSTDSLVAVCDCGAREFVIGRAAAGTLNRRALEAWATRHARQHDASDDRDRTVAASQARARRHADPGDIVGSP